jgi:hypothetical protein
VQVDDEARVTKLDRTAPQQQIIEGGKLGWLGKKRNVSKSPGGENSRIQLIVCGKCDGMKGDDVERLGGGHEDLSRTGMECSESQGEPSAKRSCSAHVRYLAKDVLEGASGRTKRRCSSVTPEAPKKQAHPTSTLNGFSRGAHIFRCFALLCPCSYHPMQFNNHLLDPTQQLVFCLA